MRPFNSTNEEERKKKVILASESALQDALEHIKTQGMENRVKILYSGRALRFPLLKYAYREIIKKVLETNDDKDYIIDYPQRDSLAKYSVALGATMYGQSLQHSSTSPHSWLRLDRIYSPLAIGIRYGVWYAPLLKVGDLKDKDGLYRGTCLFPITKDKQQFKLYFAQTNEIKISKHAVDTTQYRTFSGHLPDKQMVEVEVKGIAGVNKLVKFEIEYDDREEKFTLYKYQNYYEPWEERLPREEEAADMLQNYRWGKRDSVSVAEGKVPSSRMADLHELTMWPHLED